MILHFTFYSKAKHIAFFVNFWAKRSNLRYVLSQDNNSCELFIEGNEQELLDFSDSLAKMSSSVFLKDTNVQLCDNLPDLPEFNIDFKSNNITPYALENNENECGFSSDEDFISNAKIALMNDKSISYNNLTISRLKDFDCDYIMPVRLQFLPKIFVCDEKNLIALSSFEKPIIRLRTSSIFRNNHDNAPLFFNVRAAFDINLFKLCQSLEGINFLAIKDKTKPFYANLLQTQLCVNTAGEFAPILHTKNKLAALFALVIQEHNLNENNCCLFYLSKENDDFIKVFKDNNEYNLLQINIPASFDEIYSQISQKNDLIKNFSSKFTLKQGEISYKQKNFYSIFCIIAQILDLKNDVLDLACDFSGVKGVRLDFKIKNKTEFDIISLIASAMSFKLAGADERNISFGLIESLAYFLDNFSCNIKDELDCSDVALLGSLFSCKVLSELVLKHSLCKLSEIYPLELP